jgi:hypothetical protein
VSVTWRAPHSDRRPIATSGRCPNITSERQKEMMSSQKSGESGQNGVPPHRLKQAIAGALLAAFAVGVAGCEREGPMERAGESIDESVEDAQDKMSDVAEEAKEDAREAKEEVEETLKD